MSISQETFTPSWGHHNTVNNSPYNIQQEVISSLDLEKPELRPHPKDADIGILYQNALDEIEALRRRENNMRVLQNTMLKRNRKLLKDCQWFKDRSRANDDHMWRISVKRQLVPCSKSAGSQLCKSGVRSENDKLEAINTTDNCNQHPPTLLNQHSLVKHRGIQSEKQKRAEIEARAQTIRMERAHRTFRRIVNRTKDNRH